MGQLERYGLYVLVVVIFLILGVAIMGSDADPAAPRSDLAVAGDSGAGPDLRALEEVPPSERLNRFFDPDPERDAFTPLPAAEEEPEGRANARTDDGPEEAGGQPDERGGVDQPPQRPTPAPRVATTYVVRDGDSYAKIARERYGDESKWTLLRDANRGIGPMDLKAGMELVIPPLSTAEAAGPAAGTAREAASGGSGEFAIHVVQRGELMGTIAKQYYGRTTEWQRIADANPDVDPKRMLPGTRLRIPR